MSETESGTVRVRLLFADRGNFHAETVEVPRATIARYDRLVDLLREEEGVTRGLYVDMRRLVSARIAENEE